MPPKKNLSRGSLSNWCDVDADADADADADISKTICRPPPYGGGRHKYFTLSARAILSTETIIIKLYPGKPLVPEKHNYKYCKTGNFRMQLIFANFSIVIKMRKLIFVNIFV